MKLEKRIASYGPRVALGYHPTALIETGGGRANDVNPAALDRPSEN